MPRGRPSPDFGKINDKPFTWHSPQGTVFSGERHDLGGGVHVSVKRSELKMFDLYQFTHWHTMWIHPDLNGFSGYDCVRFVFADGEEVRSDTWNL
jgi:hypothetical protein